MLEVLDFDSLVTVGVQTRVELNKSVISSYAKLMKDGIVFPPLTAYRGFNKDGFLVDVLVDGYTRMAAYKANGIASAEVDVTEFVQGDFDIITESVLGNIRLNSKSGFAMTTADKKNAVVILLGLYPSWSDRALGSECGIDHKTVGKYRREITEELHRQATGEPKPEIVVKEKPPTVKELKAYIESQALDIAAINDRLAMERGNVFRLEGECYRYKKEVEALESLNSSGHPKISNNIVKKLLKCLHPDNFLDIENTNPEWYARINDAVKMLANVNDGGK